MLHLDFFVVVVESSSDKNQWLLQHQGKQEFTTK